MRNAQDRRSVVRDGSKAGGEIETSCRGAIRIFWHIEDALKYLLNIKDFDTTVKDVTESALREVVGQSDLQPMLTAERQKN